MKSQLLTLGVVAALSVPHRPRNPAGPPMALLRAAGMENFYWFYFNREGVPEAEFESDVPSSIRRVLFYGSGDAPERSGEALMVAPERGFLGGAPDPAALPSWLSEADIAVYAAAFRNSGFRGPFSWYRNIDRNWALLAPFQGAKITPPALFIAGARDSVIASPIGRGALDTLHMSVPNLRTKVVLPGAGHWIQQERANEVNETLLAFLATEYSARR